MIFCIVRYSGVQFIAAVQVVISQVARVTAHLVTGSTNAHDYRPKSVFSRSEVRSLRTIVGSRTRRGGSLCPARTACCAIPSSSGRGRFWFIDRFKADKTFKNILGHTIQIFWLLFLHCSLHHCKRIKIRPIIYIYIYIYIHIYIYIYFFLYIFFFYSSRLQTYKILYEIK